MTLDPDPLHVPDDDRLPQHPRLVPDSPRRGCSVLPFLGFLVLAVLLATPRSAVPVIPTAGPVDAGEKPDGHLGRLSGAPQQASVTDGRTERDELARLGGAPLPAVPHGASEKPMTLVCAVPIEASRTGRGTESGCVRAALASTSALIAGWIGWAEPELGPNYLATRFPVGTLVRLCAIECIVRTTTDFGPSAAIDPPRIADLSVLDWEQIGGQPRSVGLIRGTIETIKAVPLPATTIGGNR